MGCGSTKGKSQQLGFGYSVEPPDNESNTNEQRLDLPYRHYIKSQQYIANAPPHFHFQFSSDHRIRLAPINQSSLMTRRKSNPALNQKLSPI